MITQQRLKEFLRYEPDTGKLIWIVSRRGGGVRKGDEAGARSLGYMRITIEGRQYQAHRLAFLYMAGRFPENQIDHIDGDKRNNAWANLREATHQQNCLNRSKDMKNSSGYKGVAYWPRGNRWRATIGERHIGYFKRIEDAALAYKLTAYFSHGEFYRAI